MPDFGNTMSSAVKRSSYPISYKLKVIKYAKKHGNRAAERVFGLPPTEKMIRSWRQQEEKLKSARKDKHTLRCPPPKWNQLEKDLKRWVMEERSSGKPVSAKMIINKALKVSADRGIEDFSGTLGWCYRFMKRQGLSTMNTKDKIRKGQMIIKLDQ